MNANKASELVLPQLKECSRIYANSATLIELPNLLAMNELEAKNASIIELTSGVPEYYNITTNAKCKVTEPMNVDGVRVIKFDRR